MSKFHIKAYFDGQGVVDRQIDAASAGEATAIVSDAGGRVLSISASGSFLQWSGTRATRFDYTQFAQELHSLLEAGLSVSRALESLGNFRTGTSGASVIRRMVEELQNGKSMSQALAAVEPPAPALLTSLIAASEHTGNLPTALARYVAYRERMDGIRKRLTTAMLYPGLLTSVGGLVIIFLLGFVVPRFAKAYDHMSGDVPLASRLIIEWGTLLRHHGGLVALVFVIVLAIIALKLRTSFRHRGIAAFLGFSDHAKRRLRDYELSRFYRTLGLQLLGGIAIVPAMESAGVLLREADHQALIKATERLQEGVSVSAAVDEAGLSSPLVMDLIRVGEKSGDLGAVMIRIADFLDESVARWMEAFTRLFEPLLMLGLGVIIAGIVVLLYLPVFDLAENIR